LPLPNNRKGKSEESSKQKLGRDDAGLGIEVDLGFKVEREAYSGKMKLHRVQGGFGRIGSRKSATNNN